jgi:hypothetical protein
MPLKIADIIPSIRNKKWTLRCLRVCERAISICLPITLFVYVKWLWEQPPEAFNPDRRPLAYLGAGLWSIALEETDKPTSIMTTFTPKSILFWGGIIAATTGFLFYNTSPPFGLPRRKCDNAAEVAIHFRRLRVIPPIVEKMDR